MALTAHLPHSVQSLTLQPTVSCNCSNIQIFQSHASLPHMHAPAYNVAETHDGLSCLLVHTATMHIVIECFSHLFMQIYEHACIIYFVCRSTKGPCSHSCGGSKCSIEHVGY